MRLEVSLNGRPMAEAGINAALAGHFGVPVIMISGDDVVAHEARELLGDIEAAVVKWSYGFHSARTLTPQAACRLIRDKVRRAMGRIGQLKPYRLEEPVRLDVRFKSYRPSEVLAYLPIVQRTDAHSVRFLGKDMPEVSRFLEFILTYEPDLEP